MLIIWILIFYRPSNDDSKFSNRSITLYGVVNEITGADDNKKLILKDVTDPDGDFFCEKLIVFGAGDIDLHIGNTVKVTGATDGFEKPSNPGQFNELNYYQSMGIQAKCFPTSVIVTDDAKDEIAEFVRGIRNRYISFIYDFLPEGEAGIVIAITVGEKSGLDDEIKTLYRENGFAHILAISGLHISLIGAGLFYFLRRYVMPMRVAAVISGMILFLYGEMIGFPVATRRAVVMMIIMLIARIIGERYDRINSLALAAIIELVLHPSALFSSGFLLSYGTVLGIAIFVSGFTGLYEDDKSIGFALWEIVNGSIGVSLTTLPVIINCYHEVPIYSVLVNIVLLPFLSILLIVSLFAGVLSFLSAALGGFFLGAVYYILVFYNAFLELVDDLYCSSVIIGQRSAVSIVIYYLGLLVFVFVQRYFKNKKMKKITGVLVLVFSVVLFISPVAKETRDEGLSITNLDVGQGDCAVIRAGGMTTLIDGGSTSIDNVGKYRIVPYLKYTGVKKIDQIFITHCDEDHISGIEEIIKDNDHFGFSVENVFLPHIGSEDESYTDLKNCIDDAGITLRYIEKGDSITLPLNDGSVCRINCLHPYPEYAYEDANDYSTVLEVEYGDFSGLFTGDLGEHGEEEILDSLRDIDYLKVGHHGSKYSSSEDFLDIIKPEVAVASAGKNNRYGHPAKEAVQRITSSGARFYTTIESGAVTVTTDGTSMNVREYKNVDFIAD